MSTFCCSAAVCCCLYVPLTFCAQLTFAPERTLIIQLTPYDAAASVCVLLASWTRVMHCLPQQFAVASYIAMYS